MTAYDLTFFKFLGGIVVEEGASTNGAAVQTQDEWSAQTYGLAPSRPEEAAETPADQIIFNSLWTTQHRRSSIKAVIGKVSNLKDKFDKGKRAMSGVFSGLSGSSSNDKHAESTTAAHDHHQHHHAIPSFQAPVQATSSAMNQRRTSAFGFQGVPHEPEPTGKAARRIKGPPPPQHPMTLAKGWNSGLAPQHLTKQIPADY